MKFHKKIQLFGNGFLKSLQFDIGKRCAFENVSFLCQKGSLHIDDRVVIFRKTEICSTRVNPVKIGYKTFINQNCLIRPGVEIGKNVALGPNVSLISDTHEIGDSEKRARKSIHKSIFVGDGTWIGANSTVLPGVTIGEGTIIGAGSLVNKNCESNSLYAGNPARFIKKLD